MPRLLVLLGAMSKALQKRGVLMTATSRKRGSWKDLQEEDVDVADSDEDCGDERKKSQLEWLELEREVQSDLRKKEFASGVRQSAVVAYDDVAGDEADEEDGPPSAPSSPEAADAAEEAASPSGKGPADGDERVVPEGVTTAGDQAKEPKKRGGKKETGAARRKRRHEGEDGPPPKKKKEDEDPDRWLKMRLEGEEKPKRIDATRVVHYHDFDSSLAAESASASVEAPEDKPVATPGSFRASVRRDLFDGSDDDDE